MGVQATGYEKVAHGYPDHVTAYYMMIQSEGVEAEKLDKAFDCLHKEAGEAWLDTNSILFRHTLEYQNKLSDFLTESEEDIEVLHDRIWTVIVKVMEDAGTPTGDILGIAVCLVDMLPTIPIHLAFHSSTAGLTGFVPEVYATRPWFRMDVLDLSHMPPLQSNWKALDVLCEEIIKNMGGASKMTKTVEPAACFAVAPLSIIGGKACRVSTGDGPTNSPCASRASHSLGWHSRTRSWSPWHHSHSSQSSSSSSGSGSRSQSASGTSSSGSLQSGSHVGSRARSQAPSEGSVSRGSGRSCSASPDIVLLQGNDDDTGTGGEEDAGHSDDKETLSLGIVSLLDISASDSEDAHKAIACKAACKAACKGNVQYGNWQDEQICQGKEGNTQHNKGVNDYADGGKPCKAPDEIGPPIAYMEECRVFKPLDTIANPLGLCQFYRTDPLHSNVITGLKSAAGACRIKHLLEKAKDLRQPFTTIVFEGGNVMLLGLLQELHL